MGPEKASLGRVVWKFQRTRVLMVRVANILCIVMAAIGPVSAVCLPALVPRSPDWQRALISYFPLRAEVGLVHCCYLFTPWGEFS